MFIPEIPAIKHCFILTSSLKQKLSWEGSSQLIIHVYHGCLIALLSSGYIVETNKNNESLMAN